MTFEKQQRGEVLGNLQIEGTAEENCYRVEMISVSLPAARVCVLGTNLHLKSLKQNDQQFEKHTPAQLELYSVLYPGSYRTQNAPPFVNREY